MTFAVDAYEVSLRQRGLESVSIIRARAHLDKLLQVAAHGHRPLAWLTPKRAAALYAATRATGAVDTHRNALAAGKSFGRFATERGWLPADPFAAIKGMGRRKRGKPQLHVTEAQKLIAVCYAERSRESLVIASALLLGLGASEVAHRQVRDLDEAGTVLRITKGKNRYRERSVEVPEPLRSYLLELAVNRPGAAYLFGATDLERPSRYWVHYHCKRLCKLAKVPEVPPHGLRGTHSTIVFGAVATSHTMVAALAAAGAGLGHAPGSPITASTYVAPGAIEQARQRAAARVLVGNFSAPAITHADHEAEKPSANGGTRTPTVLPTGT